ncbi:hypothetical protein [Shinella sp. HZN7]|uniref:hypothetical protein n=1 Tax=Shinella sp. (strain HZN7) TaxID=879274 RepID=UPI0011AB571C|nr:hypothetical protein [Shinella sp. HZN7]
MEDEMLVRIVPRGIEQQAFLGLHVVARPGGMRTAFHQREGALLAGQDAAVAIEIAIGAQHDQPVLARLRRLLIAAAVAVDAARQEIAPLHRQPPVAGMAWNALDLALWPVVLDVHRLEPCIEALAIGAFAVEQLFEDGLDRRLLVAGEVERPQFLARRDPLHVFGGELKLGFAVRWPRLAQDRRFSHGRAVDAPHSSSP